MIPTSKTMGIVVWQDIIVSYELIKGFIGNDKVRPANAEELKRYYARP